jgi:hypothetical protein
LLDPRFKKYGLADPAAFEKTKAAITKAASHIVLNVQSDNDETSSGNNDHNDGSDNDAQKDEFSIWADYDNKTWSVFLNATAAGIVEVNRYIQEPIIKRSQNPLIILRIVFLLQENLQKQGVQFAIMKLRQI